MRKSKIVKIEGVGEVTVKEVSPYAIYQALLAKDKLDGLKALAVNCIDLDMEKLLRLYGSEIEQLVTCFLEVNTSFLAIAEKLGVKETLLSTIATTLARVPEITDELLKNFPPVFASLFKEVMDKMPGTMDGDILQQLSKRSPEKEPENK